MKTLLSMTSIEQAQALLEQAFDPKRAIEEVDLAEALNRQMAQDVFARAEIPNFCRSTKDGYAVCAPDTQGASEDKPVSLTLVGEVQMGKPAGFFLTSGQAATIPTGGMLPEGATGVVMLEYCQGPRDGKIWLEKQIEEHENVVLAGADVRVSDLLIASGKRLRPQELGLLASQGMMRLSVLEKIKVGIISTGNEIVAPELSPALGEVRDINSYILQAEVQSSHASPTRYPVAQDEYEALKGLVCKAFRENHLVLVSGGSSVGARDYCVDVFREITGQDPLFHGIPLKPGKPALAAAKDGKILVGLPGHPVSSRTVFDLLVRPLLQTAQEKAWKKTVEGRLSQDVYDEKGRDDHIKVCVGQQEDGVLVHPLVGISSMVTLLTQGDGEIVVAQGIDLVKKDSCVTVFLY